MHYEHPLTDREAADAASHIANTNARLAGRSEWNAEDCALFRSIFDVLKGRVQSFTETLS